MGTVGYEQKPNQKENQNNKKNEKEDKEAKSFSNDEYTQQKIINNQELKKIEVDDLNPIMRRSIGALTYRDKNNNRNTGTAFLISRDTILTSAHNLYNYDDKYPFHSHRLYLEQNGRASKYYEIKAVRYPEQYKTCEKTQKLKYDFALAKLQKEVSYEEFLQLSIPCQFCIENNKQISLSICGYPSNVGKITNYKTLNLNGQEFQLFMYGLQKKGQVQPTEAPHKICYKISTQSGQSGSPVVANQKTIIAIHNGRSNKDQQTNIGRIFDSSLIKILQEWCIQLKCHPFKISYQNACLHVSPFVKDPTITEIVKRSYELSQIDITKCIELLKVDFWSNNLSWIDTSHSIKLKQLCLSRNHLKQIDVRTNINLEVLSLYSNQLHEIDLHQNINLKELNIGNNKLKSINVQNNKNLRKLFLYQNQLQDIDLRSNVGLLELDLNRNHLKNIDVSHNTNLIELQMGSNNLEKIDLSENKMLSRLSLRQNKLKSINLHNNLNLIKLYLDNNFFQSIYLKYSTKLQIFEIGNQKHSAWMKKSFTCLVQLTVHSQADFQNCKKLEKELAHKYRKLGKWNEHDCNYQFQYAKQY